MSRSLPPALRFVRRALQVLRALAFLHSLSLIHADLKPENILIKSYSRCEVKVGVFVATGAPAMPAPMPARRTTRAPLLSRTLLCPARCSLP